MHLACFGIALVFFMLLLVGPLLFARNILREARVRFRLSQKPVGGGKPSQLAVVCVCVCVCVRVCVCVCVCQVSWRSKPEIQHSWRLTVAHVAACWRGAFRFSTSAAPRSSSSEEACTCRLMARLLCCGVGGDQRGVYLNFACGWIWAIVKGGVREWMREVPGKSAGRAGGLADVRAAGAAAMGWRV